MTRAALVAALALLVAAPAQAQEKEWLTLTLEGTYPVTSLHLDTMKRIDDGWVVFMKFIEKEGDYRVGEIEISCRLITYKSIRSINYDKDGNVKSRNDFRELDRVSDRIIPSSLLYSVYNALCKD